MHREKARHKTNRLDQQKGLALLTSNDISALTNWTRTVDRTRGGRVLNLAHPVLWRRKSPGCNPTPSLGARMEGFAGSQDLCEKLTRFNPRRGTNNENALNGNKSQGREPDYCTGKLNPRRISTRRSPRGCSSTSLQEQLSPQWPQTNMMLTSQNREGYFLV